MVPRGVPRRRDVPMPVARTVNVSGCPITVVRKSGLDEVIVNPTPPVVPTANSVPPFSVNTVPSGPTIVGTYGSPNPGVSAMPCDSELVDKSQRYRWPSSLGTKMLLVAGLTAEVLMHHSRTALGNDGDNVPGSGAGPITVRTSRISTSP